MKVEEYDGGSHSRQILSHMVVSKTVISQVANLWKPPGLFASPWENQIGNWCVEFFREHGKPINKAIRQRFQDYSDSSPDKDTVRLVDRFLSYLSEEFAQQGRLQSSYVMDVAGKHFNRVALRKLKDDLEAALDAHDNDAGNLKVEKHRRIEMGTSSYTEMQTDEANVHAAFEEPEENIIDYPGDLGMFFRHALTRDGLVAFQGVDKVGKSFWLLDMAVLAIESRLRVAFFAIGDLSHRQMTERFCSRISRHPVRSEDGKWPVTVKIPKGITRPPESDAVAKVVYTTKNFDSPLDGKRASEAIRDHLQKRCKSKTNLLRMACYPNDSVTILQLRDIIREWSHQGWPADVCVIDYSDILAPIDSRREEREQINATWKRMRALATEMHGLVVTATQSNTDAYDATIQKRRHFSGDKRKQAHASAIIGINATDDERQRGVSRLNYLVKRVGMFNTKKVVYVAGNLAIASPHLVSTF